MSRDEGLSNLTRSLLVGISLGSVVLTQVGCAPEEVEAMVAQTSGDMALAPRERSLCAAALKSQSAADVDQLLLRYPKSRCISPLLRSMPPSVLSSLSFRAVNAVSPEILASLPPYVLSQLPQGTRAPAPRAAAVVRVDDNGNDNDNGY